MLYKTMNDGPAENFYWKGTMAVRPKNFETRAIDHRWKANFSKGRVNDLSLPPENRNCARYITDPRFVP